MTPVEQGRTSPGAMPRRPAAAAQTVSLASTPPGAQTLEILLLIRMAPSLGSARRLRPTITGAPGKAFLVKTAAKSGVGASRAMSVSVIFEGLGASLGTKSKRAVPTRKPCGRAAWAVSQARWASREGKVFWVLGTGG